MITLVLISAIFCSLTLFSGAISISEIDSITAEQAFASDEFTQTNTNSDPVYYAYAGDNLTIPSESSSSLSQSESEDSSIDSSVSSESAPPANRLPQSSSSQSTAPSSSSSSSSSSSQTPPPSSSSQVSSSSAQTGGGTSIYDTAIMGTSVATAEQLVSYYYRYKSTPPKLTCTLYELATYFITEGAAEGVRGDIAFVQAVIETGWFQYSGSSVSWQDNNFCGLGATGNPNDVVKSESAQIGVRAQIQHLKAYGSTAPLSNALVDPRFYYVRRGIAPLWVNLSGTWAANTAYGSHILNNFNNVLATSVNNSSVEKSKVQY